MTHARRISAFVSVLLCAALTALACMAALTVFPTRLSAQVDGDPVAFGTWRRLHSEILDEDRLLKVHLPRGYEETEIGYPVVYVLYADFNYLYYGEAIHELTLYGLDIMPQAIVVGVVNVRRYRDLMPVGPEGSPESINRFLRFMQDELFPFIEREYRTKEFRMLIGPQAGACFGLYSIIESPGTFDAFILNNPFRNPDVTEYLREPFKGMLEMGTVPPTYMSIVTKQSDFPLSLEGLRQLEGLLSEKAPEHLRWRVRIEETPAFLSPLCIGDALIDIFSGYPFPQDAEVNSLSDIMKHYDALSDRYGYSVDPSDHVLAHQADQLSDRGMYDASLEVLHRLIEIYPHSLNGYLRLGFVYTVKEDTIRAIQYFEECLRRDPNITPAREWLQRLKPPNAYFIWADGIFTNDNPPHQSVARRYWHRRWARQTCRR